MNCEKKLFIALTAACGLIGATVFIGQAMLWSQIKEFNITPTLCPTVHVVFDEKPMQEEDEDAPVDEDDQVLNEEAKDASK